MATSATPSDTDSHPTPFHLLEHTTTERLKVGDHVMLKEGVITRHALVQIVFSENGMPSLTLVVIKPGNRGVQTKVLVPHKSTAPNASSYWYLPEEAK